jgi:hypothetical protein
MFTVAPAPSGSVISLDNLVLDYPDKYPEGAVILRSQDSYEFRVPRRYFIDSSSILNEEISVSQPDASVILAESDVKGFTGTANPHRVVRLPVNGTVIFSLLSHVLPLPPILPSTTEKIMELLSVAQMYKMDVVLTHIRDLVAQQQPPLIRKETAFSVYALAQKHGLRTEALQAARCTLDFSTMDFENLAYEDKLGLMSGAFLHELWKYHQRVESNIDSEESKTPPYEEDSGSDCDNDFFVGDMGTVPFIDFTGFHLRFVEHREGLDSKSSGRCKYCSDISPKKLVRARWEGMMSLVEDSIAKVRFTHIHASPDGPERGVQAESDFVLGVEGTRSENEVQAREPPSLPKYSEMPSADVILRSSDLVNFRVQRSVLVTSSPFFSDMFSLPQPSNEVAHDELPVVRVPESAEVLNSLISVLYPVPPEMPHSIDNILALLAATEKYDMGAVQSSIRAEVSRKKLLSPTDSGGVFRMYAVACSNRLVPEMETAARLTLDYPLTFESIGEALRLFDGWALRDLANFRIRCVRSFVSRQNWFLDCQEGPSKIWTGCPSVESRCNPPRLPSWLEPSSESGFAEAIPTSGKFSDYFLKALQDHIKENDCHFCLKVYVLKGKAHFAEMEDMLELARNIPTRILGDAQEVWE